MKIPINTDKNNMVLNLSDWLFIFINSFCRMLYIAFAWISTPTKASATGVFLKSDNPAREAPTIPTLFSNNLGQAFQDPLHTYKGCR